MMTSPDKPLHGIVSAPEALLLKPLVNSHGAKPGILSEVIHDQGTIRFDCALVTTSRLDRKAGFRQRGGHGPSVYPKSPSHRPLGEAFGGHPHDLNPLRFLQHGNPLLIASIVPGSFKRRLYIRASLLVMCPRRVLSLLLASSLEDEERKTHRAISKQMMD